MSGLTFEQLELLERAFDDDPMWGGSVLLERLEAEVDLLLSMGLVKPEGRSYKITPLGAAVVVAMRGQPPPRPVV